MVFERYFPAKLKPCYHDMVAWVSEQYEPLKIIPTVVKSTNKVNIREAKVVLLDVYGTLLTSAAGEVGSAMPMLNALEYPFFAKLKEKNIEFNGISHDRIRARLQRMIQTYNQRNTLEYSEVNILEIWAQLIHELKEEKYYISEISDINLAWISLIYEWGENRCDLMPGASEYLALLEDNMIPYGLVTNSQFYTPVILDALLTPCYECKSLDPNLCTWSYILGQSKPSKNMFKTVLKYIEEEKKIMSSDVLYIGNDMLNDIWTFQDLGGKACLFAGDMNSLRLREECRNKKKPNYIIDSWQNLIDLYS